MAQKKPQASKKESKERDEDEAPKNGDGGWEEVTTERAPWLIKQEDITVSGYLMGRHSWGHGRDKRFYYQIKLTSEAEAMAGSGEDAERVELDKGDVVNIDETFSLRRDLAPLTDDGGKYEVRLRFGTPERDNKGKPKFWPIKVSKRVIKAPTRSPRDFLEDRKGREDEDRSHDSDDIPF